MGSVRILNKSISENKVTNALIKNRGTSYTKEEWIASAKEIAPWLDYSKTNYRGKKEKVCITCEKHGDFYISPKYFLWTIGDCPICREEHLKEEKIKQKLEMAKSTHLGKNYIYEESCVDLDNGTIKVICPKHGEFIQSIANHIYNKCNCPKCAKESEIEGKKITVEEFKDRANELFNSEYDYSLIDYIDGVETKVPIICKKHGMFYKTIHSHLGGQGCQKCSFEKSGIKSRCKEQDIIKRFKEVFGDDRYDYSKVKYDKIDEKVAVICHKKYYKSNDEHGEFLVSPVAHINGNGCPICKESRLEREVRRILSENDIKFIAQYKSMWLGLQSLDFYLPDYKIGIECQGEQHFDNRGGKYSIDDILERDNRKKLKCHDNDVKLIYYLRDYFKDKLSCDDIFATDSNSLLKIINKLNES